MISVEQAAELIGRDAYGNGDKLGSVGQVFLDDETGRPEWVTVQTGFFGTRESFVPLSEARVTGQGLLVPYDKDTVKQAPQVDVAAGHLSEQEEDELYRYYGLSSPSAPPATVTESVETRTTTTAQQPPASDSGVLTLAEERLNVSGQQRAESGRVRLRKFVKTENVSQTVPVTREEAVIQREPITGSEPVPASQLGEQQVEVRLHEQRPVVEKEVVATERVRVDVNQVTENVQVTDQVRKEDVEVIDEGAEASRRR